MFAIAYHVSFGARMNAMIRTISAIFHQGICSPYRDTFANSCEAGVQYVSCSVRIVREMLDCEYCGPGGVRQLLENIVAGMRESLTGILSGFPHQGLDGLSHLLPHFSVSVPVLG